MKIVPKDEYFWKTENEEIDVTSMRTTHLINAVKLVNRMADGCNDFEYPDCYDAMYVELNYRGIDTDIQIDFLGSNE